MIFVTVGTQISFDRLIRTIDQWADAQGRSDVFAQIGPRAYQPRNFQWSEFLDAPDFRRRVASSDVIIAHAGMGSIITALEFGKPIIVMPRLASLREHRNDHQLATAHRFLAQGRIDVAFDERELLVRLNHLQEFLASDRKAGISAVASPELLHALRSFICTGDSSIPVSNNCVKSPTDVPTEVVAHQVLTKRSIIR
jgi:UDP-N-acetylglucosamine transferase subunit ALG13